MLAYWLRNYETWKQHVDELVVLVNGQTDPEALAYAQRFRDRSGRAVHSSAEPRHDGAHRCTSSLNTEAEYVVLCEDDAYVRTPQAVGDAFTAIRFGATDIVGSPRHEDYLGQTQEWGKFDSMDRMEFRHGLWPAFLFLLRADLLATDRMFGDRFWSVGEWVLGLERILTEEDAKYVGISHNGIHLDTLFGTTFQLRAAGLTTELVHHVRLFDAAATEGWITESPPWFHITGLSTLSDALSGEPLPDLDEHGGLWTRRLAWWLRMWHESSTDTPGHAERGVALGDFIVRTGMRTEDIKAWHQRFEAWVPGVLVA